jgi:Na+/proline symporter
VLVGLIPLSLGLVGFDLLPGLQHEEQVLPLLAQKHLSEILYVVFAGVIVSSILSTVDSALLAVSALLAHNVVFPSRPLLLDRHKVRIERSFVAAAGVLAFVLALHAEGVYDLVKDASSFGSAGIFTVFMFGMFTHFGDKRSALAALITGVVVWIIAHYFFEFELSYLLSLGCSVLAYVAGNYGNGGNPKVGGGKG